MPRESEEACLAGPGREYVLTWGGLELYVIGGMEKSAEVIVVDRKRAPVNRGGLTG